MPYTGFTLSGLMSAAEEAATSVSETVQNTIGSGRAMLEAGVSAAREVIPQLLPAAASALAGVSYRGTQGSFEDIGKSIVLSSKFMQITAEDQARFGRPLCAKRTLSNLTGFVVCDSPTLAISGTVDEEEMIQAYLSGGIFIE